MYSAGMPSQFDLISIFVYPAVSIYVYIGSLDV